MYFDEELDPDLLDQFLRTFEPLPPQHQPVSEPSGIPTVPTTVPDQHNEAVYFRDNQPAQGAFDLRCWLQSAFPHKSEADLDSLLAFFISNDINSHASLIDLVRSQYWPSIQLPIGTKLAIEKFASGVNSPSSTTPHSQSPHPHSPVSPTLSISMSPHSPPQLANVAQASQFTHPGGQLHRSPSSNEVASTFTSTLLNQINETIGFSGAANAKKRCRTHELDDEATVPPDSKHQHREKARRQDINEAIDQLKSLVPHELGVKPTKVVVLFNAVDYIKQLQQYSIQLLDQTKRLQNSVTVLSDRVILLEQELGRPVTNGNIATWVTDTIESPLYGIQQQYQQQHQQQQSRSSSFGRGMAATVSFFGLMFLLLNIFPIHHSLPGLGPTDSADGSGRVLLEYQDYAIYKFAAQFWFLLVAPATYLAVNLFTYYIKDDSLEAATVRSLLEQIEETTDKFRARPLFQACRHVLGREFFGFTPIVYMCICYEIGRLFLNFIWVGVWAERLILKLRTVSMNALGLELAFYLNYHEHNSYWSDSRMALDMLRALNICDIIPVDKSDMKMYMLKLSLLKNMGYIGVSKGGWMKYFSAFCHFKAARVLMSQYTEVTAGTAVAGAKLSFSPRPEDEKEVETLFSNDELQTEAGFVNQAPASRSDTLLKVLGGKVKAMKILIASGKAVEYILGGQLTMSFNYVTKMVEQLDKSNDNSASARFMRARWKMSLGGHSWLMRNYDRCANIYLKVYLEAVQINDIDVQLYTILGLAQYLLKLRKDFSQVYRLLHYVKQKFGHYLLSERTLALIYATIQSIYYARTENWSRAASVIMSITDSVERDYGEPTLILSPWYNVQAVLRIMRGLQAKKHEPGIPALLEQLVDHAERLFTLLAEQKTRMKLFNVFYWYYRGRYYQLTLPSTKEKCIEHFEQCISISQTQGADWDTFAVKSRGRLQEVYQLCGGSAAIPAV